MSTTGSPNDVVQKVLAHPKYQALLRKRNRVSMFFFALTIVIYAGFILTLAYDPSLMGQPVGNMTISIGILSGVLICVSAVVLIALYVYISNKVFDPLLQAILKDVT